MEGCCKHDLIITIRVLNMRNSENRLSTGKANMYKTNLYFFMFILSVGGVNYKVSPLNCGFASLKHTLSKHWMLKN